MKRIVKTEIVGTIKEAGYSISSTQGAVNNKHLDYYLDEYTFRFNRRTSHCRGWLFYRFVCQAVRTEHPLTHFLFKQTGRGVRLS